MTIVTQMMLLFLIVCAIAVCLTRNLLRCRGKIR